jgi:transposase
MTDMVTKGTGRGRAARPRRKFSDEYKAGVVQLVIEAQRPVRQVARELGLSPTALARWVKTEEARRGITSPPPPPPAPLSTDERSELERLRRRVRELEVDKAILKKAAAFFAKESA